MLDRAPIIDANFKQALEIDQLPKRLSTKTADEVGLSRDELWQLYQAQLIARQTDLYSRLLKRDQLSYYTIGSSGHEANVAIAHALRGDDMAFLHYRSAGFYVARLMQAQYPDIMADLLRSYCVSRQDPISGGRHKVLGSYAHYMPPQTSTIASHLPKAVGAAMSITRAKELNHTGKLKSDSVIVCSFGDASVNHASAQTSFSSCQWLAQQGFPLPLIFVCEDNGYGISVKTPPHWIEELMGDRKGIHYLPCNGLDIIDTYHATKKAEQLARESHQPVFLHFKCVRLLGHAGSDIEQVYRDESEIIEAERRDPLLTTAAILLEHGFSKHEILTAYEECKEITYKTGDKIAQESKLQDAEDVMASITPKPRNVAAKTVSAQQREKVFGKQFSSLTQKRNMSQQINLALTDLMLKYENTLIFGEDVARKGGVYHITADLMQRFGQRRVFDTILDETMILGIAIGFAHNDFVPIPEIQFLAYYHNAEDQIRSEAATLSFFSNQQYTNPMLIRIAGYAYQKGFGGHFHNDNSIAAIRDIPGIIIASPSRPDQAAKLIRECFRLAIEERRVVIFIEPIALYMTKDLVAGDKAWLADYPDPDARINYLEIESQGQGELCIISYANGYYRSAQAVKKLKEQGMNCQLIDLQWLQPLPLATLIPALKDAKKILIVDECRQTGSLSEAIITALVEAKIMAKIMRLCAKDSFIPLGPAAEYVLPSCDDIVKACEELYKGD